MNQNECGEEILQEEIQDTAQEEITVLEEQDTQELLTEILLNSREQCQMIDTMIREQIQRKDAQIDKLHSELQFYKDDQAAKVINQVMKAVIKVRKDMLRRMGSGNWAEMTVSDLQREYSYVLDDLTDLLEQQNIDPYETASGQPFDPAIHQVHKLESTSDPALDKTIARSFSEGYTKGEKILIVERVIVYQYKAE